MKVVNKLLVSASFCLLSYSAFSSDKVETQQESSESQLEQMLNKKHIITKENLQKALDTLRKNPANEHITEKLGSKLSKFVGKELSANEWSAKVEEAYKSYLSDLGNPMLVNMTLINTPVNTVVTAMIWAIPSE